MPIPDPVIYQLKMVQQGISPMIWVIPWLKAKNLLESVQQILVGQQVAEYLKQQPIAPVAAKSAGAKGIII